MNENDGEWYPPNPEGWDEMEGDTINIIKHSETVYSAFRRWAKTPDGYASNLVMYWENDHWEWLPQTMETR